MLLSTCQIMPLLAKHTSRYLLNSVKMEKQNFKLYVNSGWVKPSKFVVFFFCESRKGGPLLFTIHISTESCQEEQTIMILPLPVQFLASISGTTKKNTQGTQGHVPQ